MRIENWEQAIFALSGLESNITMLITRIELENIKSYRQMSVDFRRGTTAISGANGAGKTTIVEAIGYALFDHIEYNQGQFVRESEKYGRVVIYLIGNDDRPYTVERRCGAGAYWFIYDEEADLRLEQRADVSDKLHELFGIDRERALNALFRDALGVSQGMFTSVFLETASKRKQTFDTLLQIEDYKTATDYLLDAQKVYKEQSQAQQSEIQRLQYETRELESWQTALTTTAASSPATDNTICAGNATSRAIGCTRKSVEAAGASITAGETTVRTVREYIQHQYGTLDRPRKGITTRTHRATDRGGEPD